MWMPWTGRPLEHRGGGLRRFQSSSIDRISFTLDRTIMYSRRLGFAALLLSLSAAPILPAQQPAYGEGARLFGQVMGAVAGRYVDSASVDSLYQEAAYGLVDRLGDPYAELVSPKDLAEFNVQIAGRYAGVGLLLEDHDGRYTVMRVFPGSPGEHGGVMEGDEILAVDAKPTAGMKFQEVTTAMKGPPGTPVKVTFHRAGLTKPMELKFDRAVVRIPGAPYAMLLDGGVGYLPLQQFTEKSGDETEAAVRRLLAAGAKSLILDLRGNGGGYTDQAVQVANLFLPEGIEIYRVKTRDPAPEIYRAPRPALAPTLPLVVLVDGGSASASEIVAGALQDHDRALVLGTISYGKGLVQTALPLSGGWLLKLTSGRWITPSGRSIQRPRRRGPDGRLEEIPGDSTKPDSARPVFKSASGRPVFGGGGITPDRIVRLDTLTDAERRLQQAMAPHGQEAYLALYEMATDLRSKLSPDFSYQPGWREDYWRRLTARGITLDRAVYDAGSSYIDRLIEYRVARVAFGDSTATRHTMVRDRQLREALSLAQKGHTQPELFALALGS
jgi:carboxyl-terminal processing protease